ncbi:two pore calcium channel protein 2-like [Coregonus clupeaformis]|uniref:two pore calcium channel protein 2-like n=1 Tax=Coregonus clupeaformis TaxID=59861 RepID=UPI001BDF8F43|nr:two pore calcium channel protein 2-like [Coregonus clupeaformis]
MESFPLLPGGVHSGSDNYRAPKETPFYWGTQGHDDELYIQQAVVLIEDAVHYRSINHRMDPRSIQLYRWYYSRLCQWGLNVVIFVILVLAFIERPSSLSVTSDLRSKHTLWEPPCGLTEGIEIICLLIFTFDLIVKSYLIGHEEFLKCKWLVAYMVVISVSVIDWTLSLSMACDDTMRIRKLIRPFYLLQNSSLMKKTLKCIKRTIPEITSVILLVVLHLCVFTMFGMLLFERGENPEKNMEWEFYFKNFSQSLTSLLVLLTTANNPDVMTPAYTLNRGFSVFFILFSGFGTYFLMNLLTAIIYNQFRGYLVMSIQTSILRRHLGIRAAFELLHCQSQEPTFSEDETVECVMVQTVLKVMRRVQMKGYYRDAIMKKASQSSSGYIPREAFQRLFDELDKDRMKYHPPLPEYSSKFLRKVQFVFSQHYVTVVGNAVALANVVCICMILVIDCEKTLSERDNYYLETINCFFILYYLLEMVLKMVAFGWTGYVSYGSNIFDGSLTALLLGLQISIFATYSLPFSYWNPAHGGLTSLWEMVRLVNMLSIFRFLRIIPNIKLMALVASTMVDLVKNLRAFAGILVVVYYVFAVLGVWLFRGAIIAPATNLSTTVDPRIMKMTVNKTLQCGSYEQLGYWSNNFDDFASALVLLYNIMMMNNWNVFLDAYARYTTEWSKLYFIAWWLTSSVMWVNLFIALILENFIYKWDRNHGCSNRDMERTDLETTIQLMFRQQIAEPTEEEVVTKLHAHQHLQHLTMSMSLDKI